MTFLTRISTLATAFLLLGATLARAEENVTVPAGRTSNLGGLYLYNGANCGNFAKPIVTFPTQPSHGSVRVEWTMGKMTQTRSLNTCKGKPVRGMQVIYTPNSGYRGADNFKIGLRSYTHGTNSFYHAWKFNITVQ